MKSREEQLEAWKAKRAKPLASINQSNILNRPPKAPGKRTSVAQKTIHITRSQAGTGVCDKENQPDQSSNKALTSSNQRVRTLRAKAAETETTKAGEQAIAPSPSQLIHSEETRTRRASLSACALEHMENQYDVLKGTLDTLKRESMRSVKSWLSARLGCTCF